MGAKVFYIRFLQYLEVKPSKELLHEILEYDCESGNSDDDSDKTYHKALVPRSKEVCLSNSGSK